MGSIVDLGRDDSDDVMTGLYKLLRLEAPQSLDAFTSTDGASAGATAGTLTGLNAFASADGGSIGISVRALMGLDGFASADGASAATTAELNALDLAGGAWTKPVCDVAHL